jgi:uncharacterized SAM-binding protein YcdF (DUF218 family)
MAAASFRWFSRLLIISLLALVAGWAAFIITLPEPTESTATTDAVVVLTGSERRIEHAFGRLTTGTAPRMFISGVYDKANSDQVFAAFTGVDKSLYLRYKDKIDMGYEAENTAGNALETARWIAAQHPEIHSIRLITARYHMPRALREFQRTMPNITIIPDPALPVPFNQDGWLFTRTGAIYITLEYFKFIYSHLRPLLPEVLQLERIPAEMRWDKRL